MTKQYGKPKKIPDLTPGPITRPVAPNEYPAPPTTPDHWDPKGVPGQNTKKKVPKGGAK
jgi:hypothetical protein